MNLVVSIRRIQETAFTAVSCFVLVLALTGCAKTELAFDDLFIAPPQQGISPQTMSGIVLTQQLLKASPKDDALPYSLSYLYLQAVRENADTDLYAKVESILERIEDHGISSPEHSFLRGLIAMAKHEFADALALGKPLVRENPAVHRYYGLLADAQIELGKYEEAVETLQSMADINPDASTLTRIAYVREIYGDTAGAKEAMEEAIRQGGNPENIAWELCELGRLWLPSDPVKADGLYDRALALYPNYAPALAGKAKAAIALGAQDTALDYAEQAFGAMPLPEYAALLGDVLKAGGKESLAQPKYTLVKLGYQLLAKDGTNVEQEQTRFLIERGIDLPSSLETAKRLFKERQTIYAADAAAWALYQTKDYDEAWEYALKALATGTHDPMILFHAGMIAKANGDAANAKTYLETVKKESPYFSLLHGKELEEALASL